MSFALEGWLRSSNKPSLTYMAVKGVLTLRNILASYPFRLGTVFDFHSECDDASTLLSGIVSCLKEHVKQQGELEALTRAMLANNNYDSHVQEAVVKFTSDVYRDHLKLAERAGADTSVVQLQVI
jgi:hypothetical protein